MGIPSLSEPSFVVTKTIRPKLKPLKPRVTSQGLHSIGLPHQVYFILFNYAKLHPLLDEFFYSDFIRGILQFRRNKTKCFEDYIVTEKIVCMCIIHNNKSIMKYFIIVFFFTICTFSHSRKIFCQVESVLCWFNTCQ